jgi:3',5'-cyclic AMP phosphodiesterase CpdA
MRRAVLFSALVLAIAFNGCSSDEDAASAPPSGPGGAGTSGNGGTGTSGSGGASGSGGTSGGGGTSAGASGGSTGPTELAPLSSTKTTLDETRAPAHAVQDISAGLNPAHPENLEPYISGGYGVQTTGPGEPHTARTLDGSTPPAPGPNAKRLVRFAHVADLQLSDDESPTRAGIADAASPDAALRPQDPEICRMTNAAVRTINALSATDPVDFVLLGGDNADSAQSNEVDWVMSILNGSDRVECDSGDDDDMFPGADDGKDPFVAEGLKMPWYWVTGNHDVLVQGTLAVTENRRNTVLGTKASAGTRTYASGGRGKMETGDVVIADPKRALLDRKALMAKVAADKDGHGLGAEQTSGGKATYTFDVAGTPLRFLVMDTGAEQGGSDGMMHQADVDALIKPRLDQAKSEGKYVVLASHHAVDSLTKNGGTLGVDQPDALLPDDFRAFMGAYDNVVFSVVAHTHRHQVKPQVPATGHGWWEVMTSSIADHPSELRILEIFDQDNGWLMMRGTCVDLDTTGDPVAENGRTLAVVDFTTGWLPFDGRGDLSDRNVELWIKKP